MKLALKQFSRVPNAGDAASALIVAALTGREVDAIGEAPSTRPNLLGVGSILHWADERSVVWGAGLIAESITPAAKPKAVLAVRGPLSRDRLAARGVACPDLVGDPGALLPRILPPTKRSRESIGLAPHYVDADHPFVQGARAAGLSVVDPTWPLPKYVETLTSCSRVISSSLHGLVFAHAYGIPAAWIRLSDRVFGHGFKYRDYYASIGVRGRAAEPLSPEENLERIVDAAATAPQPIRSDELAATLMQGLHLLDA